MVRCFPPIVCLWFIARRSNSKGKLWLISTVDPLACGFPSDNDSLIQA